MSITVLRNLCLTGLRRYAMETGVQNQLMEPASGQVVKLTNGAGKHGAEIIISTCRH